MSILAAIAKATLPPSAVDALRRMKADYETRAELVGRIRSALPDFAVRRTKLIDDGFDHAVLIVDGEWVFRFPRDGDYRENLHYEARLLAALQGETSVSCPVYSHLVRGPDDTPTHPAIEFGAYRMIAGREMYPEVFAKLSREAQEAVLTQLAEALSAIHGLSPELITRPDGRTPQMLQAPRFTDAEYIHERLEMLAPQVDPGLQDEIARFYEASPKRFSASRRLLHSDVTYRHLFLKPDGRSLALIDFGEAAVGDPAWDFAALWGYGDWAPRFVLERYAFADEEPGILERSRFQYAHHLIDCLWWPASGRPPIGDPEKAAAELRAHFAAGWRA